MIGSSKKKYFVVTIDLRRILMWLKSEIQYLLDKDLQKKNSTFLDVTSQ